MSIMNTNETHSTSYPDNTVSAIVIDYALALDCM